MVKENRWDRITDKLKARTERISGRLSMINKGVNPYRQEPVSTEERLWDFSQLSEEDMQMGRQEFGDEAIDAYQNNINELLRRKK